MAQLFLQLCMRRQGRGSRIGKLRQPRNNPGGWKHTVKHICITTASYSKWSVEGGGRFVKNDTIAQHLLALCERLDPDNK